MKNQLLTRYLRFSRNCRVVKINFSRTLHHVDFRLKEPVRITIERIEKGDLLWRQSIVMSFFTTKIIIWNGRKNDVLEENVALCQTLCDPGSHYIFMATPKKNEVMELVL